MTTNPDKRSHPRFEKRIKVRATGGDDLALETINLSSGGLFCTSPAWVAPMTRLALSLELPPATGNGGGGVVHGEAVVVRTEPSSPTANSGGYRIALFFSRMDDEHRQTLQTYLTSRLN